MPIKAAFAESLLGFKNNLLCIENEELHINGAYSSEEVRTILNVLERCSGHAYCNDDATITEYF